MTRLPTQYVDAKVSNQAGQIIMDAIREAGVCPRRAMGVSIIRELVTEWGTKPPTAQARNDFIRSVRNVAILNPTILEAI
jgi:hypothetical protein